jgi:hypothetical protein
MPLASGIIISKMIRSGENSFATAIALLLFSSVLTLKPSFSRLYLSKAKISPSSSTTRIFEGLSPAIHLTF